MSIIESIEKLNDHELGYRLKTTDGGLLEVTMDNGNICCEMFDVYALKNNKNWDLHLYKLVGKTIQKLEILPIQEGEDGYEKERNVEMTLEHDPIPLVFCFYNSHNGYYRHYCEIQWQNIKNIQNVKLSFRL